MKILVIEDERQLSRSIVDYLTHEGYLCEQAFTVGSARMKVSSFEYDCILLDLMLPDGSGLDVLRLIKQKAPNTGVIIASAKDSLDDKVAGLQLGADDYLAKPFHLSELSMRIFALLRRRNFDVTTNTLVNGPIIIDLLAKTVMANGHVLTLTRSEYKLLLYLIKNKDRVLTKDAIAEHLAGDVSYLFDDIKFIYAHIKNLKKKLAEAGVEDCMKNVYGMGYKWALENE